MNFYTQQHTQYCGIDLQARALYVGILDHNGTKLVHKNLPTTPETFLRLIAPYREDMVVGVECMFTWDGRADLWAKEGSAFVLGPALSMNAIHGGKAQNDTIDVHKSAVLLRGGRFPQADLYPAERRATRALLRRRCPLMRQRAELVAHIQNTTSQYNLPEVGKKRAYKGNREGVEEPCPAPRVRQTIEVDLALIAHDEHLLGELELSIARTAKPPAVHAFCRLRALPGIGKSLALVILSEVQAIERFPRVPDFVSYCRLVKGAKESAGKRPGVSGKQIGNAPLKGACSEAAVLFLRQNKPGQAYFATLERQPGKAKALPVLAHKLARAVYFMLSRHQAFDLQRCVTASPLRGEPEPGV